MVALADKRNTASRGTQISRDRHDIDVAASAVIYQGALVGLSATGFLAPMSTALNLTAVGRAEESCDNSSGADGDIKCKARSGIHKWVNDGGTPLTVADVGADCWAVDDQTVSGDSTGRSKAGKVYEIDPDGGVWVATIFPLTDA